MRRLLLGILIAALCGSALGPAEALAEPGPIQLVSTDGLEQAEAATTPAISADGRYVAFKATLGGEQGIFRKDLQTGAVVPVLTASAYSPPSGFSVSEPSISADGRYVSFTTTASLVPGDGATPADSDVYVADMSTSPPTYELASALNGSNPNEPEVGLTYEGTAGSIATGRVSLSANGREVVFVTLSASNLTGDPEATETPPLQVVWRDLETKETKLISVERNPVSGEMTELPVPGRAVMSKNTIPPGASISADGSTVAWLGTNLPEQVSLPTEEQATIEGRDRQEDFYDEPLWRRVPAPGESTLPPTRRIVGGSDGPFPGLDNNLSSISHIDDCAAASGWNLSRSSVEAVPVLSADGRFVATIGEPNGFANAFLVDMASGLSRAQAIRPLTREIPSPEGNPCAANSTPEIQRGAEDVSAIAISASGSRVAFATRRQLFPLAPPNLVGAPPSALGAAELYLVDLGTETLQRLTRGTGGPLEPSLEPRGVSGVAGATAPSFSADGETIAFASQAQNLVAGDANEGSDVFVITDPSAASHPGGSSLSSPPPPIGTQPRRQLIVTARSRPDGSVRLIVTAPGPGRLRLHAKGAEAEAHGATVANLARRLRVASVVIMSLRPRSRFRKLVRSKAGLEARLSVTFAGSGGKPLKQSLEIRFRQRGHAIGHPAKGGTT